ncbi:hypothetical protein GCM10012320_12800 [Sinomonas cellulolyticus]|jgi:DnaJ-class molecular chaperone|uniref:J domain-containing protein n=1 Tax=Sinomonas cellulolyticus TaxID=2801916 RepID=A0ABS1JZ90_9MICC|nr:MULTISPECIES: DnaJ domain-containing protein [Sinomonas]MBL0704716.1 J domain-containing protein [Sinomonas cellulolyticus]GHG46646.1 hypothetical protein GCM10012320_12800 [Sinomonas sp. KCTC 49339]
MRGRDFYDVLGVERSASPQEVRAAYRRLLRELHPDRGGHGTAAERERLGEIMEAYAVLGREDRRAAYDAALERAESVLWARELRRSSEWLAPRPAARTDREDDLLWFLLRWFP